MAGAPNPAQQIAAVYIEDLKKGRMSLDSVISVLKGRLNDVQDTQGHNPYAKEQQAGYQEALNYALKVQAQQDAASKSGNPASKPNPAVQKQVAALKSEGQQTAPNTIFGQMYNQGSTNLNTTGLALLSQAVGSKYSFVLNNMVTPGKSKALGSLGSIIKGNVTIGTTLLSLMQNQDQKTILGIQAELTRSGYLDPLHTTNLTPGVISSVNDPTLQALAQLMQSSQDRSLPVSQLLQQGFKSRQGQDWGKLWQSVVQGTPFSITGHDTNVQSPNSLADQLRQATTGAGGISGGSQSVLSGGAGENPSNDETQEFIKNAQQYQKNNPSTVTTQYEPQPGLGISGFTRFPLQKNQTTTGGVDSAAMDQFTYNWLIQNFGSNVAATGAANLLGAFNQLIGLNSAGTGTAPGQAAGQA